MKDLQGFLYNAERDHWWFQARRIIATNLFWNKLKNKNMKVLSIGCGTGQELEHISQYASVSGIDIDPSVVSFVKKQGFDVVTADILDNPFLEESFDVIVAMDVIEHIEKDYEVINVIHKLLKPGGKLLVTVPACPFLWSKYDEVGEFPHFRRYTYTTLKTLLMSKFSINSLSYYNFFLFPLVAVMRKLNFQFSDQLAQPSSFINGMFRSILTFERFLLPVINLPIGISLIAVVEKKK